jgi:hypothetical protein
MNLIIKSILSYCVAILTVFTGPVKAFSSPNDYVPISRIMIESRFTPTEVTRQSLPSEVHKCIPQWNVRSEKSKDAQEKFPEENIIAFGHENSSKTFLLHQTTGICIEKSSNRFPIFASEAFIGTVNPMGVPPQIVDEWYKQIALLIATKGVAKVAYVFENGNIFAATYWVEPTSGYTIFYDNVFKKAGTWENEKFDAKFSHLSISSVTESKRDGLKEKRFPLAHQY